MSDRSRSRSPLPELHPTGGTAGGLDELEELDDHSGFLRRAREEEEAAQAAQQQEVRCAKQEARSAQAAREAWFRQRQWELETAIIVPSLTRFNDRAAMLQSRRAWLLGRGRVRTDYLHPFSDKLRAHEHANDLIRRILDNVTTFYIGVTTQTPSERWEMPAAFGQLRHCERFDKMLVAIQASGTILRDVETDLIDIWKGHAKCVNRGRGGGGFDHSLSGHLYICYKK